MSTQETVARNNEKVEVPDNDLTEGNTVGKGRLVLVENLINSTAHMKLVPPKKLFKLQATFDPIKGCYLR